MKVLKLKNASRLRGAFFNGMIVRQLFHPDLACVAGVAVEFDGNGEHAQYERVPEPCERSVSDDCRLVVIGYPCKDERKKAQSPQCLPAKAFAMFSVDRHI